MESGEDTYHYDLPMRQKKCLDPPDIITHLETSILPQDEGKAQIYAIVLLTVRRRRCMSSPK